MLHLKTGSGANKWYWCTFVLVNAVANRNMLSISNPEIVFFVEYLLLFCHIVSYQ